MAKYKIVDIDESDAYVHRTPENKDRIIGIVGEPVDFSHTGKSNWMNGSFVSDKPVEITIRLNGQYSAVMEKDFFFYRVKIEKVEE